MPFDSECKFTATFHDRPDRLAADSDRRGGAEIPAANQQLSEQGLRDLTFAARKLDDGQMKTALADSMASVRGLVLVALVGIVDLLRSEARDAVRIALAAGIDVRMITGDQSASTSALPSLPAHRTEANGTMTFTFRTLGGLINLASVQTR